MPIVITQRPHDISFSGNPVFYELLSEAAQDNQDIYFEIKLLFQPTATSEWLEIITDWPFNPVAGKALVNVQDLLHAQLDYGMPELLPDETTIQPVDSQAGLFYIQYREITPGSATPGWDNSEAENTRCVVKGGLNYFKWQGNNFWVNLFAIEKPFLTWQLNGRLAHSLERMYLAWLNIFVDDTQAAQVVQRVKITYLDGTTATFDKPFPLVRKNQVVYVPTGYTQLNLATYSTKKIYYWEIQIVSTGGDTYSQSFKYLLSNKVDYNNTFLHYRSSLGGLDSVQIAGVIEVSNDYQFSTQARSFKPDYFNNNVITPQLVVAESAEIQTFSGNVGWMPKVQQDRMRDIHVVRQGYIQQGNKWLPLVLTTKGMKLYNTNDTKFSMPVEWQLAHPGAEYYTPTDMDFGNNQVIPTCLAYITGLTIATDFENAPDFVIVTFNGTENDIEDAAQYLQYRVVKPDNVEPVFDWVQVPIVNLPYSFQLPVNGNYQLEVQALCDNQALGPVQRLIFDTNYQVDPPPPVVTSVTATFVNKTTNAYQFNLVAKDANGGILFVANSNVAHYDDARVFTMPTNTPFALVQLNIMGLSFTPAEAQIRVDGNIVAYGNRTANKVEWTNVAMVVEGDAVEIWIF